MYHALADSGVEVEIQAAANVNVDGVPRHDSGLPVAASPSRQRHVADLSSFDRVGRRGSAVRGSALPADRQVPQRDAGALLRDVQRGALRSLPPWARAACPPGTAAGEPLARRLGLQHARDARPRGGSGPQLPPATLSRHRKTTTRATPTSRSCGACATDLSTSSSSDASPRTRATPPRQRPSRSLTASSPLREALPGRKPRPASCALPRRGRGGDRPRRRGLQVWIAATHPTRGSGRSTCANAFVCMSEHEGFCVPS